MIIILINLPLLLKNPRLLPRPPRSCIMLISLCFSNLSSSLFHKAFVLFFLYHKTPIYLITVVNPTTTLYSKFFLYSSDPSGLWISSIFKIILTICIARYLLFFASQDFYDVLLHIICTLVQRVNHKSRAHLLHLTGSALDS